jgi:hypothetical protein
VTEPTCFIAMPMTTHPNEQALYIDVEHWTHVMEWLFVPAIEAAGFRPVLPKSKGANLIHADIVKKLETSDMVLCDFSGWNVNVFFELGVRVSLDKPMALVHDEVKTIPFDLGGVNAHKYESGMRTWETPDEIERLSQHIRDSAESCGDNNPLWKQFGLTLRAQEPVTKQTPETARVDLLSAKLDELIEGLRTGVLNPQRVAEQVARENLDRYMSEGPSHSVGWTNEEAQLHRKANRDGLLKALWLTPLMEGVHISARAVGDVVYIGLSAEQAPETVKSTLFELASHYGVPIRFEYVPYVPADGSEDDNSS